MTPGVTLLRHARQQLRTARTRLDGARKAGARHRGRVYERALHRWQAWEPWLTAMVEGKETR